jgi:hypothetical protein
MRLQRLAHIVGNLSTDYAALRRGMGQEGVYN